MLTADTCSPPAGDPFHNFYWLATFHESSTRQELWSLTNLQDKLKHQMLTKHRLGGVNTDTFPKLANLLSLNTPHPDAPIAHNTLSNKFWQAKNITFKDKQYVMKYHTDTRHTAKHSLRFEQTGSARCPLCGDTDSANHLLLRCNHPTLQRMHINRHHLAVSHCGAAISEGDMGSSIITMDAHNNDKLSNLNIEPPSNIQRRIPDWVFGEAPVRGVAPRFV